MNVVDPVLRLPVPDGSIAGFLNIWFNLIAKKTQFIIY